MRKLIAAINMTLDGFCDHTSVIADEELHDHYTELIKNAGAILYGRITYQLMEFWPEIVKNPTGNKSMDDFAVTIDNSLKIVFSRTLKNLEWKNSVLAKKNLKDEIIDLKQQEGKNIFVGSPGLISQCTILQLIDEYQLCIHPIIAGKGLPLFKNINEQVTLKLLRTKQFGSGAVVHYYKPVNNKNAKRDLESEINTHN